MTDLLVLLDEKNIIGPLLLFRIDVLVVERPRLVCQHVRSVDLPLPLLEEIVRNEERLLQEIVILAFATNGLRRQRESEHGLVSQIAQFGQDFLPFHLQLRDRRFGRLGVVNATESGGELAIRRDRGHLVLSGRLWVHGRGVHLFFHTAQANADCQRPAPLGSHQTRCILLVDSSLQLRRQSRSIP